MLLFYKYWEWGFRDVVKVIWFRSRRNLDFNFVGFIDFEIESLFF